MWCTIALRRYRDGHREVMLARELTWSDLRLLGSTGAAASTRAATVAAAPTATALSLTATTPAATAAAAVASSLTTLVALDLVEAIVGVRGSTRRTLNGLLANV
jgi:acid phosphatase family membrane protein YuiD